MTERRFSRPGKPATEFEHALLAGADALEDPWVEIANIIGLDATLALMDRFQRTVVSIPAREVFIRRLCVLWLDDEALRLRRQRNPRLKPRDIANRLNIPQESIRKRAARAEARERAALRKA